MAAFNEQKLILFSEYESSWNYRNYGPKKERDWVIFSILEAVAALSLAFKTLSESRFKVSMDQA